MKKNFSLHASLKIIALSAMLFCSAFVYTSPVDAASTKTTAEQENTIQTPEETAPVQTGLVKVNGRTMYIQKNGTPLKNDKVLVNGYMYVFGKTGLLTQKYKYYKPQWIKKSDGYYYWRQENGKILKKRGWHIVNNKKYFLLSDGKRAKGWTKVGGKYLYFQTNGLQRKQRGLFKAGGSVYCLKADFSRATGMYWVNGKRYYFHTKTGKLIKDQKILVVDNKYYSADKDGVITRLNPLEAQAALEAQKIINKCTNSSMSREQKLRACFNYTLWNIKYKTDPFDKAKFEVKDWQYQRVIQACKSGFVGNCYAFACIFAACAKELGYEPYVIVAAVDHGFVQINGLYYDNMGPLFGVSSPKFRTWLHRVKF